METTIEKQTSAETAEAKADSLRCRVREISQRLRTQDNRCTDLPIFLVQAKRRIHGLDTQYSDDVVWVDSDGNDADETLHKELEAKYDETGDESLDGYTRTSYIDIWEFKTACLTEQGAKDYIAQMAHHLNEPRIYVESGYRNDEWRDVRAYLSNDELTHGGEKK